MIKFRAKQYAITDNYIVSDTVSGAIAGAGAMGVWSAPLINKVTRFRGKGGMMGAMAKGVVLGAGLGALVGLVRQADLWSSRLNVDDRLMKWIVQDLKNKNFKEGEHFTRDPKRADELKTRVSIVISRRSGDLNILINTVDDPKLNKLTDEVTKNIPNSSVKIKKVSDKYNEITLSTISDSSADPGLVAGISERFIRAGYPIYLVEVG